MRIGIDCFEDVEIRSMIKSGELKGHCDITGKDDVFIYDTNIADSTSGIGATLVQVLDVYTAESELPSDFPKGSLARIEDILATDWSIFSLKSNEIKVVIMELCKESYSEDSRIFQEPVGIERLCDQNFRRDECITTYSTWDFFMSSIKNRNRFHSNHINLTLLEKLFASPSLQRIIPKDSGEYYRARIGTEEGYLPGEMGAPPSRLATAGRANSKGISCLYLAGDEVTTFHEIRARDLDYVSVGRFVSKRELKIVDLSSLHKISPFSTDLFDMEWFAVNMNILKQISKEIAKPLRRQDSELDYLPAQYIADFVKSLGYDGICYRSTLNEDGLNYAIFDEKKFKCVEVKVYHIASLSYQTTQIS